MEEPSDLTETQRQRADALVIAARLLGNRPPDDQPDPEDLVDLAQFILDGTHPLAEYRRDRGVAIPGLEYGPEAVPIPAPRLVSTPGDIPGDDQPQE